MTERDNGTSLPPVTPQSGERRDDGEALPRVEGYEILERLGEGGMGIVYKAWHKGLRRYVALKVLRTPVGLGKDSVQRFHIEARAAARLRHPNIVAVHDVGVQRGDHFFTMDLIDGCSLAKAIAGSSLSLKRSLALVEKVARAVHYAHEQGIIHRDLKPGNILLDQRGEPLVTDFGLAKDLHADRTVTREQAALGTPSYMSPEQAGGRSKEVDRRSDVYALGAVLYELLVGRPPFRAGSVPRLLRRIEEEDPVPPRRLNGRVPRDVQTICLKCLAKERARRYPSAQALADDVRRFLNGEPIQARPSSVWYRAKKRVLRNKAAAALTVLVVALAAALLGIWLLAPRRVPTSLVIIEEFTVQVYDQFGEPLWRKQFEAAVRAAKLFEASDGGIRAAIAVSAGSGATGRLVVCDDRGNELWTFHVGERCPYEDRDRIASDMAPCLLLIGDLHPQPGTEILYQAVGSWFPCEVCILSENGKPLGQLWHPGNLGAMLWLKGPRQIVLAGCNNRLGKLQPKPEQRPRYRHGIFCVDTDKLAGQCPPHTAPGFPPAVLRWYKVIAPIGSRVSKLAEAKARTGPEAALLEVWTSRGWVFWLNAEGQVLQRSHADEREEPPCELIDAPWFYEDFDGLSRWETSARNAKGCSWTVGRGFARVATMGEDPAGWISCASECKLLQELPPGTDFYVRARIRVRDGDPVGSCSGVGVRLVSESGQEVCFVAYNDSQAASGYGGIQLGTCHGKVYTNDPDGSSADDPTFEGVLTLVRRGTEWSAYRNGRQLGPPVRHPPVPAASRVQIFSTRYKGFGYRDGEIDYIEVGSASSRR